MSKTIKGYIAGSIFDSLIAKTRIDLTNKICSLSNDDIKFEIFNPIESEINTTKRYQVDVKDLYKQNNNYMDESDFIILDLTDHNSGVLVEFGRITTLIDKVKPGLRLYVLWRLNLCGENYLFSVNRYIRGAVEKYSDYYENEEQILEQIKKDFLL